jgi:hypothetical protein
MRIVFFLVLKYSNGVMFENIFLNFTLIIDELFPGIVEMFPLDK